ncbi:MAG: metallopeptidase family protein [Lachnospiraceae bacterium]
MTVEEFRDMLDAILEEIPEDYYVDLNGGVQLIETEKIHPKSIGDDLVIMGEYIRNGAMGRNIHIYYGSFMRLYGRLTSEQLKQRVKETVLHELMHHLESLAGYRDLEVEDEIQLADYLHKKKVL